MSIVNDILFPKEQKSFLASVVRKLQDCSYLVQDSSGKQYKVEASQNFAIGASVICKNGVIIRATGTKLQYKHFVV